MLRLGLFQASTARAKMQAVKTSQKIQGNAIWPACPCRSQTHLPAFWPLGPLIFNHISLMCEDWPSIRPEGVHQHVLMDDDPGLDCKSQDVWRLFGSQDQEQAFTAGKPQWIFPKQHTGISVTATPALSTVQGWPSMKLSRRQQVAWPCSAFQSRSQGAGRSSWKYPGAMQMSLQATVALSMYLHLHFCPGTPCFDLLTGKGSPSMRPRRAATWSGR